MSAASETVVARHAEDAAFFWSRREAMLGRSVCTAAEFVRLDERVDANLDGLWIAGPCGWDAAWEQMTTWGAPDELFVAAFLAFATAEPRRTRAVFDALAGDAARVDAAVAALGWHDRATIEPLLCRWATASEPLLRALAIGGLAAHRCRVDGVLEAALADESAAVAARAAGAAGELGRVDLAPQLRERGSDPPVRFQAARALARLGATDPWVHEALAGIAEKDEARADRAIAALVHHAPGEARGLFNRWRTGCPRLALGVAAELGDPGWMPEVIALMASDELARAAGDAFAGLTGVDLEEADLAAQASRDLLRGPSDDPDDDRVELDRDDGLAWPAVAAVTRWWTEHGGAYRPGERYLGGVVVGRVDAGATAEQASQLRRAALAGRPKRRRWATQALAQGWPDRPRIEHRARAGAAYVPGGDAWLDLDDGGG